MARAKYYVYLLKSLTDPSRSYAGTTRDWRGVLDSHNSGKCSQSADGRPWAVDLLVPFEDESRAAAFERYVKSARKRTEAGVRVDQRGRGRLAKS